MKTRKQKLQSFIAAVLLTIPFLSPAQNRQFIAELPTIEMQSCKEHQYLVVTDYLNHSIYAEPSGKLRISGKYTSGLPGGKVQWSGVSLSRTQNTGDDFPEGSPLAYMEQFSYSYEQNILAPEFFNGFPTEAVEAKNLVWDMAGMEFFAWGHSDALKLNVPYHARQANGKVDLAGLGFFDNRDIVLTWKGMTERNGELLALIDFRTLNNPLAIEMDMGGRKFQTKGRSHYWGTIWLSVEQQCMDEIVLYEDVVLEIGWDDQPEKELVDVVREMKVTKIY